MLAAVAVAVALASASAATARPDATNAATVPGWLISARAQLPKLKVRPAHTTTRYDRSKFGTPWQDVDKNGCDTRNDILARDLADIVLKAGSDCMIARGTLRDPYTATTIDFVQGKRTSMAVQVDHVVALAAAWRTGAATWTATRRLRYANDRLVLLAVDGPANRDKSDQDAADWLPANTAYDCRYVARQISIKTKYHLWLIRPERQAMRDLLAGC